MSDNLPAKKIISANAYAWKVRGRNSTLDADGFYISYNQNTGGGISLFAGDGSGEETALCKDGAYYILNGDWRKQYEAVFEQGFEACYKVYLKHRAEFESSWSNGPLDEDAESAQPQQPEGRRK